MNGLLWLFAGVSWSASTAVILLNPGSKLAFVTGVLINILGSRAFGDLYDWLARKRLDALDLVEISLDDLQRWDRERARTDQLLADVGIAAAQPAYPSYPKGGGPA